MKRPFTLITILLLLLVALAHYMRVWQGWTLTIAGEPVPMAASIAAIAVSLLLALGLWWELMRARSEVDDWKGRERARPRGPRGGLESTLPDEGMRLPSNYFTFASSGIPVKEIKAAAAKYGRIMVGFDAGNIPPASLKAAQDAGAELAIYVEGPGGPTGSSWAADERQRVKEAAKGVGIDIEQANWMREWDRVGWKIFTFLQLEGYLKEGYGAAEIDNLDRVLGDGADKTVAFFKEYAELHAHGKLPRLVTKNLNEEKLEAVVAAVEAGELPRAMFSEFHISEKGSGDRKKQDALSSRIGIRTVASNDTHNYDARGEFGLDDTLLVLLKREQDRAIAAASPQPSAA